jgi:hypothetical protein
VQQEVVQAFRDEEQVYRVMKNLIPLLKNKQVIQIFNASLNFADKRVRLRPFFS